jgi:flagellar hook capping protein FlgD
MLPSTFSRRALAPFLVLGGLSCFAASLAARPVETPPPFQLENLNPPAAGRSAAFGAAATETVYFGGTVWAADSARWEAIRDSCWTFDTGRGSHFNKNAVGVDQFKDPSLHAYMEGWVGIDRTSKNVPYFRRMPSSAFGTGQNQCVITGSYSFWCGITATEAPYMCFAGGQGYGDNWHVCIERSFTYNGSGTVTVQYSYKNDTELDFDYTTVYCDTTGNGANVVLASYNSLLSGTASHILTKGLNLRSTAGTFKLKYCVDSDQSGSDQDGAYDSKCGAFALDNVSVSGGGISYASGFETGADGFALSPDLQPKGGDWSNIVHVNDLPPPLVNCVCNLQDTVLVFQDVSQGGGHNLYQNSFVASPWIDLKADNVLGAPNKFVDMSLYADLPLLNYVYAQFFVQYYPYTCPSGGKLITSPWIIDGITHYFGSPTCTQGGSKFRVDFSSLMDVGAQQVRIGVGVFSGCLFYPNCTGLNNSSPWYDNIRFGVAGTFSGTPTPIIAARSIDLPQDAFPENGSLHLSATARLDSGTLKGGSVPGPLTELGDTLVVEGGSGGAEVWVQLAVRPGPGINASALTAFKNKLSFIENRRGQDWYAARMDTAEQGGVVQPGYWMTTFHESSPSFVGKDTDKDGGDLDPHGSLTRLANDIFPDNLFTPGTRVSLFYKTKFTAGTTWYVYPDTTGGQYLEMEVLPSSMTAGGAFNCVLYVEHAGDGQAPVLIQNGLKQVLSGTSANFEQTRWDRYDVRGPSSHQATFGRPAGSEYGATVPQAMGYKGILWNSGGIGVYPLVEADADVLTPWLTLFNQARVNNLYLSGDGLAAGIMAASGSDPGALSLLEDAAGTTLNCDTYSASNCPAGTPSDLSACVPVNPAPGAVMSLRPSGGSHQGQGNGCPQNRSFDVLKLKPGTAYGGTRTGEERYVGSGKTVDFASISQSASGNYSFRTVVDGLSLDRRRLAGDCLNGSLSSPAIAERLQEVLGWFGLLGPGTCSDPSSQVGIGDEHQIPALRTELGSFLPNPLRAGSRGSISFTLDRTGPARVTVVDLQGRVIKTLFDETAASGPHQIAWDGTDNTGRPVAGGVYLIALRTTSVETGKKMVMLRH